MSASAFPERAALAGSAPSAGTLALAWRLARRAHQHGGAPAHQTATAQREDDEREREKDEQADGHGAADPDPGVPPASMSSR